MSNQSCLYLGRPEDLPALTDVFATGDMKIQLPPDGRVEEVEYCLRTGRWQMMLIDDRLEGVDFVQLLADLRRDQLQFPVVFLNHQTPSDQVQKLAAAGAAVYPARAGYADLPYMLRHELDFDSLHLERGFFYTVLETVASLVIILDREQRIVRMNSACERMTGYTSAEVEGRRLWEVFLLPEEIGPVRAALQRLFTEEFPNTFQNYWMTRTGDRRLIAWTNTAMGDATGQLEYIIASGTDITDSWQAEQALRASEARYHRIADDLALLYRAATAITSSLDLQQVEDTITRSACDLLSVQEAVLLVIDERNGDLVARSVRGGLVSELMNRRLPPVDPLVKWLSAQRRWEWIPDALADDRLRGWGAGLAGAPAVITPLVAQDTLIGSMIVFGTAAARFDTHTLEVLKLLTATAAIAVQNARLFRSEQERLRELQVSQEQLVRAEKMAALGRLTASIVHEVNNPLQSVQTCLAMISEDMPQSSRSDSMAKYLHVAISEIDRISAVTRRLRDFYRPARAEADSVLAEFYRQATYGPVNLSRIAHEVLELVHQRAEESGVRAEVIADPAAGRPQGNYDHLHQVFLNLVINALDAMPSGGRLTISIRPDVMRPVTDTELAPAVRVEVTDTGAGISEDVRRQLFDPFFTTKESGSGLGLPTCYQIIQSHGGAIFNAPSEGPGTRFVIQLPLGEPA